MLLVLDDNQKELLEKNGVQYLQFEDVPSMYLNELLTGAIGYAVEYNEVELTAEVFNQYVAYVAAKIDPKKYYTKVGKMQQDILQLINNECKNKHEEIMAFVPSEAPSFAENAEEVEGK
jgi:hypothetical protein